MKSLKRFLIAILLVVIAGYVVWNHTSIKNNISQWLSHETEQVDSIKSPMIDAVTIEAESKARKTFEIPMTTSEDSHFIIVKVNGIPMKFTLDSGCNTMSVGYIEYMFLKNQGLVHGEVSPGKEITLADGSKRRFSAVLLDSISIGDATLRNIECVIAEPDSVQSMPPCLIGLNTFYKFAKTITVCPEDNKLIVELK